SRSNTLVSKNFMMQSLTPANARSDFPDISYDGRFVAFRSEATNIAPFDVNGWPDVFLYDRIVGTNRLLGVNQSGKSGNNRSLAPVVFSGDGRSLVFPSWASDLIEHDFNQNGDLFVFTFL